MRNQLAAAVPPLRFDLLTLLGWALLLVSGLIVSGEAAAEVVAGGAAPALKSSGTQRYFAEIRAQDTQELAGILDRASEIYSDNINLAEPIVIILHGPEGTAFRNSNYSQYKMIVDLAAQLEARHIIDIKMCDSWLEENDISPKELPDFVDTVPYGPASVEMLQGKGYVRF